MVLYPNIDPVAVQLGPVAIRWYGLAYVVGILLGWWLLARRAKRPGCPFDGEAVSDMVFYAALGAVLGGRLGYALFYKADSYLADPSALLRVWEGGMAFHGGVIGFMVATAVFARRRGVPFLAVTDFLVPVVPVGLFFGRCANFINGELWGRTSDLPWAMVFPTGGPLPRHPSQLYEAALEGLVLFAVLYGLSRSPRPLGLLSGLFLTLYGSFRFLVEFAREPDAHLGFIGFGVLSMGQILSVPMVLAGFFLVLRALRPGTARFAYAGAVA